MEGEYFNSVYIVCNSGVYSIEPKRSEKIRYPEIQIHPKKSIHLPIGENGIPISRERQDEIIRMAAEMANRRTHSLVLGRQGQKGTLAEKVA
jgi:hypothetical protein